MSDKMFRKISKCRVCGNPDYNLVLDLGEQYLSGIFPKEKDLDMPKGPLRLVKCNVETGGCGHVQLEHTYDLPTMYGDNYGYRSGLNSGMVQHLQNKAINIQKFVVENNGSFDVGDIVVDIAGNDGTFLGFWNKSYDRLIIDPTSNKFQEFIPPGVKHAAKFFSKEVFQEVYGDKKAKVVTTFSMFYDLDDPCKFAREVNSILDDNGIWVLEQSYVSLMLKANSFDTICHEHLSYYAMEQIEWIMQVSGFKVVDYEFNDVNGGSISIIVAKENSEFKPRSEHMMREIAAMEKNQGLQTSVPWDNFKMDIEKCKNDFLNVLSSYARKGKKIAGLGASTKGNVLLQSWGITNEQIEVIGDVNPDKHGSFTPGTWIPIADEESVLEKYEVFVVLPWHFREFFMNHSNFKGKTLIFPLPTVAIEYPSW
mgnify:CR=1 FL=1|tara:strand:+ start:2809 stop:4080 length:1272 start_codon:yes stop_codon:yes gene_type:complete